jgi:hypothetical protein
LEAFPIKNDFVQSKYKRKSAHCSRFINPSLRLAQVPARLLVVARKREILDRQRGSAGIYKLLKIYPDLMLFIFMSRFK